APNLFEILEEKFPKFLDENINTLKGEFYIPIVTGDFVKEGRGDVKVIGTTGKWFGVTYKEDAPTVKQNVHDLVEKGIYPHQLWS
ncbi:hypothetical protein, partial [Staphylococcus gallinarum]|uniref:hypothetical protein n=1 Tax=Staphylococcus gallinarum TaxID=1293 RepID=UPI0031745CFB